LKSENEKLEHDLLAKIDQTNGGSTVAAEIHKHEIIILHKERDRHLAEIERLKNGDQMQSTNEINEAMAETKKLYKKTIADITKCYEDENENLKQELAEYKHHDDSKNSEALLQKIASLEAEVDENEYTIKEQMQLLESARSNNSSDELESLHIQKMSSLKANYENETQKAKMDMETKFSDYEELIGILKVTIKESQNHAGVEEKERKKAENEHSQYIKDLEEYFKDESTGLHHEIQSLKTELDRSKSNLNGNKQIQDQITLLKKSHTEELIQLRNEITQREKTLEEFEVERHLVLNLADANFEKKAKEIKSEHQSKLLSLENTIHDHEIHITQLSNSQKETESKLAESQKIIASQQERVIEIKDKFETECKNIIEELYERQQAELTKFEKLFEAREGQLQKMKTKIAHQKEELAAGDLQIQQIKKVYAEDTEEIKKGVDIMENTLHDRKEIISTQSKRIDELITLAKGEDIRESFVTEIAKLNENIDMSQKKIISLENELLEKSKTLEEDTLNIRSKERERCERKLKELSDQLEVQIVEKDNAIENQTGRIAYMKRAAQRHQEELTDLRNTIATTKKSNHHEKDIESSKLRKKMDDLENDYKLEITELREKLYKQKKEHESEMKKVESAVNRELKEAHDGYMMQYETKLVEEKKSLQKIINKMKDNAESRRYLYSEDKFDDIDNFRSNQQSRYKRDSEDKFDYIDTFRSNQQSCYIKDSEDKFDDMDNFRSTQQRLYKRGLIR
jgi:hypothetical protein